MNNTSLLDLLEMSSLALGQKYGSHADLVPEQGQVVTKSVYMCVCAYVRNM